MLQCAFVSRYLLSLSKLVVPGTLEPPDGRLNCNSCCGQVALRIPVTGASYLALSIKLVEPGYSCKNVMEVFMRDLNEYVSFFILFRIYIFWFLIGADLPPLISSTTFFANIHISMDKQPQEKGINCTRYQLPKIPNLIIAK